MIEDPQGTVLTVFAVFSRIGACFMVLPGFSSARVPAMIRLFIALAVSMALTPLLWDIIYPRVSGPATDFLVFVFVEVAIGTTIGLIARYFVLGLQFTGTVLTMMAGFNAPPTTDVLEDAAENQLTNLISFAGLLVLFVLDFHHLIITALTESYISIPAGMDFNAQGALITLTDTLSNTFMVMIRLASPFVVFGFLFNVSIGFINKLSPQIPIYFVSAPFLVCIGLIMVYIGLPPLLKLFAEAFVPIFQAY